MGHRIGAAHDTSVADRTLSHFVRKSRRATSPRYAQGEKHSEAKSRGLIMRWLWQ